MHRFAGVYGKMQFNNWDILYDANGFGAFFMNWFKPFCAFDFNKLKIVRNNRNWLNSFFSEDGRKEERKREIIEVGIRSRKRENFAKKKPENFLGYFNKLQVKPLNSKLF